MAHAVSELLSINRGHFSLESCLHGDLWTGLGPLFSSPSALHPFISALSKLISLYKPAVICGPLVGGALVACAVAEERDLRICFTERELAGSSCGRPEVTYRLPKAFMRLLAGQRVAIVAVAINAGSAVGKPMRRSLKRGHTLWCWSTSCRRGATAEATESRLSAYHLT